MKYCRQCKRISFQKQFCRRCGTALTACSKRSKLFAIGGTLCAALLCWIVWNSIIPEFYKIKPGIYEVGVDIPAGEYVAVAEAPGMFGRVSGNVYQTDPHTIHILDYDFADNRNVIFTLKDGQFVELKYGCMYQSSKPSLLRPFAHSGVFRVGRDLLPGVYVIKNTSAIYQDSYHVYTQIGEDGALCGLRQQDVVPTDGSTVVTLRWGDYLDTGNFCRLSLRPVMLWEFGKEKHALKTAVPEAASPDSAEAAQKIPEGCFGDGTYEIGVDLPAGEYVITAEMMDSDEETPRGYLAVYTDASLSEETKLRRSWLEDNTIMVLEDGQFIILRYAYLYESSGESRLDPFANSGLFKIGRDIKAGTYTIVCENSTEQAEYSVFTSLSQSEETLRSEGTLESGSTAQISLEEGDYLLLRFCHLKKNSDLWPFD